MTMMPYYSEKFSLKRNDFRPNSGSPYRDLWYNPDLSDVTLVSEEDQQIEAHQIAFTANRYLNKQKTLSTNYHNAIERVITTANCFKKPTKVIASDTTIEDLKVKVGSMMERVDTNMCSVHGKATKGAKA